MNDTNHGFSPNNQAWVTYIYPSIRVLPTRPVAEITLEQINRHTYNNFDLCEVVAAIEFNDAMPYQTLICGDGGIALPKTNSLRTKEKAMEAFNKLLCTLLIGGIQVQAVDLRDIVWGRLHDNTPYIFPVGFGQSLNSMIHAHLRLKTANSIDTINLLHMPEISILDFQTAFNQGENVLSKLSKLSPTFLLRGFTELCYHNWSDALSNLWVCVEQLTTLLWQKFFLEVIDKHPTNLPSRLTSLKDDNRTWSTAIKQEILWQLGVIKEDDYLGLYSARKARNALVHSGQPPCDKIVKSLYDSLLSLMGIASGVHQFALMELNISNMIHDINETDEIGIFEEWDALSQSL